MSARADKYGIGQEAEQDAAHRLASCGWTVIPISEYNNNTGGMINAPMLVIPGGVAISPDLLAMKSGKLMWVEVKDKAKPTYTWKNHRWEHGIDKPNIDAYLEVQEKTGIPVIILVHENFSPETPDLFLDGMDDISAYRIMNADLQPSSLWLKVSLNSAIEHGSFRDNNPKMMKPGNPKGTGFYWPRNIMKEEWKE